MNLVKLENQIKAVCPVEGISIGDASDKTTWAFHPTEAATTEQIAAAQAVIDNADLSILDDAKYIPCKDVIERLSVLGKYETVKAAMSEVQKDIFFSLSDGVRVDEADVIALLTACGIDPKQILF